MRSRLRGVVAIVVLLCSSQFAPAARAAAAAQPPPPWVSTGRPPAPAPRARPARPQPPRPRAQAPAARRAPPEHPAPTPWDYRLDNGRFPVAVTSSVGNLGQRFELILSCWGGDGAIALNFGTGARDTRFPADPAMLQRYVASIMSRSTRIEVHRGGSAVRTFSLTEGNLGNAALDDIATAESFVVEAPTGNGGSIGLAMSAQGSARAVEQMRQGCAQLAATFAQPAAAPPASGAANGADLPAAFAAGTLELNRRGGCRQLFAEEWHFLIASTINRHVWGDTVRAAISHGCGADIIWFALGLAAENLGYPRAAAVYYARALQVSRSARADGEALVCAAVRADNPCLNLDVPSASAAALQRVRRGAVQMR